MSKGKELIFLFSIIFLQVKNWLPVPGDSSGILSGDNALLVIGMLMALTSNIFKKVKVSNTTKYAFIAGSIILFVIPLHRYIKDLLVFSYSSINFTSLIRIVLRLFMIYFFLKYLNIGESQFKKGMHTILIYGVIVTLSMLFEDLFIKLGFAVDKFKLGYEVEMITEAGRYMGLTGMNANDLGALFCIFLGILFCLNREKLVNIYQFIFYLLFLLIGVLLTGSRTAFVVFNIIAVIFIFDYLKTKSLKSFPLIVAFFLIIYYLYENFGLGTLARIEHNIDSEQYGLGARIGYWVMYLNDIYQNPIYLITGNLAPSSYPRSAHNYYIQIVFHVGIIFVSAAFYFIYKSVISKRPARKNSNIFSIDYKYLLIPQLTIWMTTFTPISWFGLISFGAAGVFFVKAKDSITDYKFYQQVL